MAPRLQRIRQRQIGLAVAFCVLAFTAGGARLEAAETKESKTTETTEERPPQRLRTWVDHGKAEQAIPELTEFLKSHPGNKTATFWRGIGYASLYKYDQAIADYKVYLKSCPQDFRVWQRIGRQYMLSGQNEKAIETLSRSIKLCPNEVWAFRDRGSAYKHMNKKELADADEKKFRDLKKRFGNRKKGEELEKTGNFDQALLEYKNSLGWDFDEESMLLKRAELLFRMAEYEKCVAQCDEIVKNHPQYYPAFSTKAKAEVELGDPVAALAASQSAISIEPDDDTANLIKARAEAALGKLPASIADYTTYLKLHPDGWDAYMERGDIHAKLKKYKEAIADYSAVGTHNPSDKSVLLRRSRLYLQLKEYDAAIKDLTKFQKLSESNDDEPYVELAHAYEAAGRYSDAVAVYSKALALDREPSTLDGRALAYEKLGDKSHAQADRDLANKLRSTSEQAKKAHSHSK